MRLNTISPGTGLKQAKKRVGRGLGSGRGKTSGRGQKGQKSRSGGLPKIGFEGGQMPLQLRIPKLGFTSRKAMINAEIRLQQLNKLPDPVITLEVLRGARMINKHIKFVKVILSGKVDKPINLKGIKVTKGAKSAIEAAGGKVEG